MRLQAEESCLLVVDLQDRLLPAVAGGDDVVGEAVWLIKVARELAVPVRLTEQYPHGLGATVPAVRGLVVDEELHEKVHFACTESDALRRDLVGTGRRQVVIAGAEAHVCVLQSALGLLREGYAVFVVAEAVASRRERDRDLALERMRQCGIQVLSREMVAFEWLNQAGTDAFRRVQRRYIR